MSHTLCLGQICIENHGGVMSLSLVTNSLMVPGARWTFSWKVKTSDAVMFPMVT